MKTLSKEEIINETVSFYSADPKRRNVSVNSTTNSAQCNYVSTDGRNCAVGRCLTTKVKDKLVTSEYNSSDFQGLVVGMVNCSWAEADLNLNKVLKPSYRGHNLRFWEDLQSLHDVDDFWDETGLTIKGNQELDNLTKKYASK
jgi:hypothetical protein